MGDPKPLKVSGPANLGTGTRFTAEPNLPSTGSSSLAGGNQYSDPFFSGGLDRDSEARMKSIEDSYAIHQGTFDKLGNGLMKMVGSFSDGILSTLGTIYGIATSPISLISTGETQVWDNPFSLLGDDINNAINANFVNYRDLSEQNASAWSPKYWKTMNFFSDNILGNLGFAGASLVTGVGISKVLSKLAPYIAAGKLSTGLEIMSKEGIEGLTENLAKTYSSVKKWDRFQQALSVGISASGEASTEAVQTYRELKKQLTNQAAAKYGSEDLIPESVLKSIDNDAHNAGSIDYMINIPILAGANVIQWGRALSPFKSELKAFEKNPILLKQVDGLLGEYAEKEIAEGGKGILSGIKSKAGGLIHTLQDNLSEAGQEGAQYIAQQGTENWYQRKNDPEAWNAVHNYMDPYLDAAKTLFTTQEGVANLLGGFTGGSPFAISRFIGDKIRGVQKQQVGEEELGTLNNPYNGQGTIKENLKIYLEAMARHNSAQHDLNESLSRGDEHGARNAKYDILKTYIRSRIETGRADLLNDEIEQMRSMSNDDFNTWLNLDQSLGIKKDDVLNHFKSNANDMLDTYRKIDRVFNADMFRINRLPEEKQKEAMSNLAGYKEQLWNYMMDYKDRESRWKQLDKEIASSFGDLLPLGQIMEDKFGNNEDLNNLYKQYTSVSIEHAVNKAYNPQYKSSEKESELQSLKTRLKAKMNEVAGGNLAKYLSVEGFMEDGKKDYIENYLMNLDKQIGPILNNPIVQSAMGVSDINETITKIHDLHKLHVERRAAIHSYNQLASMVKNGEYMEPTVKNPDYDPEKHKGIQQFIEKDGEVLLNPEYVPERISNDKMLDYNGYAKNKDERLDFYKDLDEKRDKDAAERDAFTKNLSDITDENLTDLSKSMHDKSKQYQNGTIQGQKLKAMTDLQLQVKRSLIERKRDVTVARAQYDMSTKKGRDGFDYNDFIDQHAQLKAVIDEQRSRRAVYDKNVKKAAIALVSHFYAHKMTLDQLTNDFAINGQKINPDVIKEARKIIIAKQQAEEEERRLAEEAERAEVIVDKDMFARFNKDRKLKRADLAKVTPLIAAKIAAGQVLTSRENSIYQVHKEVIDKKAKGLAEANLQRQKKGRKSSKKGQPEPQGNITRNIDLIQRAANKAALGYADREIVPIPIDAESFMRLRRSDLLFDEKEGQHYDKDGNAVQNMITNFKLFTDPNNPLNLHNNPLIQFKRVEGRSLNSKEPLISIQVSADGATWEDTGYYVEGLYNKEGKQRSFDFGIKDETVAKAREKAFKQMLTDVYEKTKDGPVPAKIRGGISFGQLITNKPDENGHPEPRGILTATDSRLNNVADPHAALVGVIQTDSKSNVTVVQKLPNTAGNELTDVNDIPGVSVDQRLLNALVNATPIDQVKGTGDRAGQFVLMLPLGRKNGTAYEYFPVLLSGKLLNTHTSNRYDVGSGNNKGTPNNIGEVLIDALLNPHADKYNSLFKSMFEMEGLEYKGEDSNWKEFYQDDRINRIINKVLFASGKSLDNATEYTQPFKFEVTERDKDAAVRVRLGIADPYVSEDERQRRTVDVFITTKEGKLVKPQSDDDAADFVQSRINEEHAFRKKQGKVVSDKPMQYEDIQNVLKAKAYHVQIGLMSQNPAAAKAYTGFTFDEAGNLITKTYPNYFHWVDELGLANATVQGINDTKGNRQYFVNQRVYMQPLIEQVTKAPAADKVSKVKITKAKKTMKTASISLPKSVVVGTIDENTTVGDAVNAANGVREANNIARNSGLGFKKKGTPMLDLNLYRSVKQRSMKSGGTAGLQEQERITDELTAVLLNMLMKRKGKAGLSVSKLKADLKSEVLQQMMTIIKKVRSMGDMSVSEWLNLPEDHPSFGSLENHEIDKLSNEDANKYAALESIVFFDDIESFKAVQSELDQDTLDLIIQGFDNNGEPLFFIGYLNKAIARATELGIIKATNVNQEYIDIDPVSLSYEQRFNDNWSLKVNPKNTIGFQAKCIINTIPDIKTTIDKDGNVIVQQNQSATGSIKNLPQDYVHSQITEIGLNSTAKTFEYNLMHASQYEVSPVIRAVRMRLNDIKKESLSLYNQIIRQLGTATVGMKRNGVFLVKVEKSEGFNATTKIFSGAKIKISDQIVSEWQGQFMFHQSQNNYVTASQAYDPAIQLTTTKYSVNKDVPYQVKEKGEYVDKKGTFAEAFKADLDKIFSAELVARQQGLLSFQGYVKLANAVKDRLGIELVHDDFSDPEKAGYKTAAVLKALNEEKNNRKSLIFSLINRGEIKKFDQIFYTLLHKHIAQQIVDTVETGHYDTEEPFGNSSGSLDTLAKLFMSFHPNIFNSQATNIEGDNEYTIVPGDMLHAQIDKMKDEQEAGRMLGLPIGEHDYFTNAMFKRNEAESIDSPNAYTFAPPAYIQNMKADLANGIELAEGDSRKTRKQISARKASIGDAHMLSFLLYQNDGRETARYFTPFGDSSAASFVEFAKFPFKFDFNGTDLVIQDEGPDSAFSITYSQFKNEMNRALKAFEKFNNIVNQPGLSIEQQKAQLDEGYHYTEKNGLLLPGAAMRIHGFGREIYDYLDDDTLFNTYELDKGQFIATDINSDILTDDGEIDDKQLLLVFTSVINKYLGQLVNAKLKSIEKFIPSVFTLSEPVKDETTGKYKSPKYKSNIFDNGYIQHVMKTFGRDSKINGKLIRQYNDETKTLYDTPEEANANGFHMQLLKAIIIDQQVNHQIFATYYNQHSWDLAAFGDKATWALNKANYIHRSKANNSPFISSVSNTKVRIIPYYDVLYSDHKISNEKFQESMLKLTAGEQAHINEMLSFLTKNGMTHYADKKPSVQRYKELTVQYLTSKKAGLRDVEVAQIMKDLLDSKITDGGTVVTLREHLFQLHEQGQITDKEFGDLWKKYNSPGVELTVASQNELKLTGKKYVAAGAIFTDDRKVPVYVKDGKIVLIPAQVKGTKYEAIFNDMAKLEDQHKNPSPGVQLAPMSAIKVSNAKPIRLFNDDGDVAQIGSATAVLSATPLFINRDEYGEQVQNPAKENSEITGGIQLQKYLFVSMNNDRVFAPNRFKVGAGIATEKGIKLPQHVQVQTIGGAVTEEGITARELLDNMVSVLRHIRNIDLQKYIDDNGLDYTVSDLWSKAEQQWQKDAAENIDKDFQSYIDRLHASKVPEEREQAEYLDHVKYAMKVHSITKMLNDIKQQAYIKGVDVAQMSVFDNIIRDVDGFEQLKMSLSFTPGSKQYQQIIVSSIEKLIRGIKYNGFSGVQGSAFGFSPTTEGSSHLKGYGYRYDNEGKIIGFDHAEIAVPWIFRDASGKLLDYDKYVNADGSPKTGMFDNDVLNIISYRIPNTGLNMAGRFKIARFMKPNYTDVVLIPDILYSQMGTDLDFDKLYSYLYNHQVNSSDQVQKVKGVLNMRQVDAYDILLTKEHEDRAIDSILSSQDPTYIKRKNLLVKAVNEFNKQLTELSKDDNGYQENLNWDEIGQAMTKKQLAKLKAKYDEQTSGASEESIEVKQLKSKYDKILKDNETLQSRIDSFRRAKKGFNMKAWLQAKRDNYLKCQTREQLENAYMDIYHIVMSDMDTLPAMMKPLTSKAALDTVNDKIYDGKSFSELKGQVIADLSPTAEVVSTINKGNNAAAEPIIGGLANAGNSAYIAEKANISLGLKINKVLAEDDPSVMTDVIAFNNEEGEPYTETGKEQGRFTRPAINDSDQPGYEARPMQLEIAGKVYNIPNRLDRITDVDGKTQVTGQMQSLLQGYLDLLKAPNIVDTNVNMTTLNAALIINRLGYVNHMIPFLQQEAVRDYVTASDVEDSPFSFNTDPISDMIIQLADKAGIAEAMSGNIAATNGDVRAGLALTLADENSSIKLFSLKDLHNMIIQQFDENKKDQDYYLNQLHVLNMFFNADSAGQQLFQLSRKTNLESKGFDDSTVLGVVDKFRQFNKVSDPFDSINLIGSERIGKWDKRSNPDAVQTVLNLAFSHAEKASNWLYSNHNIFSDLSPLFRTVRNTLSGITGKWNIGNQQRFNINFIQYVLSNPELYDVFTDTLTDNEKHTASGIRSAIFRDTIVSGKITKASLARRIQQIKETIDPETNKPYAASYPVLNYFKTRTKNDMSSPSWVWNYNTNQFKERMGQEMPYNIVIMLEDKNPEIQRLAKDLYLYYYMGGGITTPQSFGHLLAQEMLFQDKGFADKLNDTLNDIGEKITRLDEEVRPEFGDGYDKPRWFRVFDQSLVKSNKEASDLLHSFFVQYVQNHPFADINTKNFQKGYKQGREFQDLGYDNQVRITQFGKLGIKGEEYNPAAFLDDNNNVYVINGDYDTYTRYNRAGLPLYTEYDYSQPSTRTLIQKMNIKTKETENTDATLGTDDFVVDDTERSKQPFTLDKETEIVPVMRYFFNDSPVDIEEIEGANAIELNEIRVLGQSIIDMMPANTSIIPYSIKKANQLFQPEGNNGQITVRGLNAFGAFVPGPDGKNIIQVAFDHADRQKDDPLLIRKIILHESAHGATQHVMKVLKQVVDGTMTTKQAHDILRLDNKRSLTSMKGAYKKLDELFNYLKDNSALRKEFVKQNGGEANRKQSEYLLINGPMANLDEFIGSLFENHSFREALKAVPYKDKNIFERILEFIKDVLGLQSGTAAYSAFGNVFTILDGVKASKIPVDGYSSQNVDQMFSANKPLEKNALYNLRELYKGVSNFDSQYASPEELETYDKLVKEGKIIC